jgi:mannose-6-phosphate isomerase class I
MSVATQPYAIIPLLVEQPTWGGTYIAESKHISDPTVADSIIGQSYELAGETVLATTLESKPAYIVSSADLKNQTAHNVITATVTLSELIEQDPVGILGDRVVERYGKVMPLLIKFTQAQENSYQVHVTQATGNWLPKPESWYFFEAGKATLGLNPNYDIVAYKTRCLAIEAEAIRLSQRVQQGLQTVETARQELTQFIEADHPRKYVNTVDIPAQSCIDLSTGGIHHSWEKTDHDNSKGNIVYEVQLDVKDDRCTLRSFDQGKMKDDGSVRTVTIAEYFEALITDPNQNDPTQLVKNIAREGNNPAKTVFSTTHYTVTELSFTGDYSGAATTTNGSFHHLYAKTGSFTVQTGDHQLEIPQGWSGFIPAQVGAYHLHSIEPVEVLVTTIGN